MNRKQFIILLVLVVGVGAAGWLVHQRDQNSWHDAGGAIGGKLLPALAVNDIAQLTIKSGDGELNLAKRDNLWRVRERGDYPANFSQISDLLIKFGDLKIAQSQEVGASQLGRFQLLPPGAGANAGTLVEFKDQSGKSLGTVLLGKPHQRQPAANSQFGEGYPDGRYVMVGTNAGTLAVISDPLENVQPKPEQWLNKDFFSIEKPSVIAAQFPETTNSWKLMRAAETNDWQLVDAKAGEKLDAAKISSVTRPFSSASFNDVAPLDAPASLTQPTNGMELTVETLDGFTYVIHVGGKAGENYPVSLSITANLPTARIVVPDEKPADKTKLDQAFKDQQARLTEKLAHEKAFTNRVFLLPAYTVDEIFKPRNQLLMEVKKDETATAGK
jgi:hypothetical protein